METLAVLADIHGNMHALTAVLADIEEKYPETGGYLLAGDYTDYCAFPNECLHMLEDRLGSKISASIIGNHDIAVLENDCGRFRTEHGRKSFDWSAGIVDKGLLSRFALGNSYNGIILFHGSHRDVWENVFPKDTETLDNMTEQCGGFDVIIVAHSHLQFLARHNGKIVLNPGSVGQPRNGDSKAQYAVIIKDGDEYAVRLEGVEYDIREAAAAIVQRGLPRFLAVRLFLGI